MSGRSQRLGEGASAEGLDQSSGLRWEKEKRANALKVSARKGDSKVFGRMPLLNDRIRGDEL